MNYSELAPAYIRAIAPYQPGKPIAELERELGITGIVKLASNENPLGCSPRAVAAMHEAIRTIALYPDGNGFELKDALSRRYGVEQAGIVLGNGSNDMLELAARAFLTVGDKAVYSAHAFAVYPLATQSVGATGISVPAIEFRPRPESDIEGRRGPAGQTDIYRESEQSDRDMPFRRSVA